MVKSLVLINIITIIQLYQITKLVGVINKILICFNFNVFLF